MSNAYRSDGRRISSMTHANRVYYCTCGMVTNGNGGKSSHRRVCGGEWQSWYDIYEQRKAKWEASQGVEPEQGAEIVCACGKGVEAH